MLCGVPNLQYCTLPDNCPARVSPGSSAPRRPAHIFGSPHASSHTSAGVAPVTGPGLTAPAVTFRIPRRSGDGPCPLSSTQRRIWFLEQLQPLGNLYNTRLAIRVQGPLDVEALRRALDGVAERHEALRTAFTTLNGVPVQIVQPPAPVPLMVTDLAGLAAGARESHADLLMQQEGSLPFDLARGRLLRARLLRMEPEDHLLLVMTHHIVSDAWSRTVFFDELSALYVGSTLPPLPVQFADFATWQNQWLEGEQSQRRLARLRTRLEGLPPVLQLPQAGPRPAIQSHRGAKQTFVLPAGLKSALAALAKQERASLYMTLLAAFQVLLARYCDRSDIAVASPAAGRTEVDIEGLIGFFANTLVLRTDLSGDPSFRELLRRVRAVALEAYDHQDIPFDRLVEELRPERSLSYNPLVQVLFNLQIATPRAPLKVPGLTSRPVNVDPGTARFDLTLTMLEVEGELRGAFAYTTDLFQADTVERMAGHFRTLLEGIARDPECRLSMLPWLTESERRRVLVDWNPTETPFHQARCVHHLVEAEAARAPNSPAIVDENQRLTYAELDRRANHLAHRLRTLGVGPEVRVGLCLERSAELIVALLAVLKAGGAYVPLDPNFPPERLELVARDAGLRAVISRGQRIPRVPWLEPGDGTTAHPPAIGVAPDNVAYVLYTSGSSGRPKGVLIEHRALTNYVLGVIQRVGFEPAASYAMVQPLTVDSSVTTIYPPLVTGGCLYLVSEQRAADPAALGRYFQRHPMDYLKIAPSHLAALEASLDFERILPRRWLLIGGEASRREWLARIRARAGGCRVFNHYGPTETTVGVTTHEVDGLADGTSPLAPIGTPLPNVRAYVLDRRGNPVPAGVPGELYIGGPCLARGYLGQPALTAGAFVPDPFGAPGERLYRTGDLARHRPDGELEFLGRSDGQVKIRGFRVELGEIEAMLSRHPAVGEVAVASGSQLAAYLVLRDNHSATVGELREFLASRLPSYMVPQSFVFLDSLPRLPHGKLDREALPEPPPIRPDLATAFVAPRTPVEQAIADIWTDVLRLERVGVEDDFFALGGHSLRAAQVVVRIRDALNVDLPLRTMFESRTVAGLAMAIGDLG